MPSKNLCEFSANCTEDSKLHFLNPMKVRYDGHHWQMQSQLIFSKQQKGELSTLIFKLLSTRF